MNIDSRIDLRLTFSCDLTLCCNTVYYCIQKYKLKLYNAWCSSVQRHHQVLWVPSSCQMDQKIMEMCSVVSRSIFQLVFKEKCVEVKVPLICMYWDLVLQWRCLFSRTMSVLILHVLQHMSLNTQRDCPAFIQICLMLCHMCHIIKRRIRQQQPQTTEQLNLANVQQFVSSVPKQLKM